MPITDKLFEGNLTEQVKDITEANKLTKRVMEAGRTNRGRGHWFRFRKGFLQGELSCSGLVPLLARRPKQGRAWPGQQPVTPGVIPV